MAPPLTLGTEIVPNGTRWLAFLVGSLALVVVSISRSPISTFVVPSTLILAAIIQPHSPRPGRWLLSVGAFYLSVGGIPYLTLMVVGSARHLLDFESLSQLPLFLALAALLVLLIWCDVSLIVDARRQSRNSQAPATDVARPADWLVFIAAASLSITVLPGLFHAVRSGRRDIWALQLLFALVVIWFDAALMIRTMKMRRPLEDRGA